MDELFEALTLIQTKKIDKFPVVLVGKNYWSGLLDWIKQVLMENELIGKNDMELFSVVDSSGEAIEKINEFYLKYKLKPNF